MKRRILQQRSRRWWIVSIAIHIVVIAILGQIAFTYPLGQLLGIPKPERVREKLQYITIEKPATAHSGTPSTTQRGGAPAALPTPSVTPTTLPPITPPDSAVARAAGATGTGFDADGSGLATGLVPRQPDSRIALTPDAIAHTPRSVAEDIDSIVSIAIGLVNDSIAVAARQRKPGDWTVKDKDGRVWGWDTQGNIRLGRFFIPGALLALLPLNMQSPVSPIEARTAMWIRRDIWDGAQRSISEDEFRDAVKRIRERKDRERRQKQLADGAKDRSATP